jgi:hypothetical protein
MMLADEYRARLDFDDIHRQLGRFLNDVYHLERFDSPLGRRHRPSSNSTGASRSLQAPRSRRLISGRGDLGDLARPE